VEDTVPDPRQRKKTPHLFPEIVVMAVCAVVCSANQWVEVEQISKALEPWFRQFLSLPNGIPSHDTFGRVFRLLRPELLATLMREWVSQVREEAGVAPDGDDSGREQIAVDGKTSRRSHDRASSKKAMHMVSAYSTTTGLVLTCMDVEDKSNEIPTVPEVLKQLNLEDAVVTMDAMGCQTSTAQIIVDGGGDYVLALKLNQEKTYDEVKALFDEVEGQEKEFDDVKITTYRTTERAHGRETTREYFLATNIAGFKSGAKWPAFHGAIKVHSTRIENGVKSEDDRYYITSLRTGIRTTAKYVRGHWGVENNLHWCLDISFREDESRIRKGYGPANFSTLCRFSFNMLKRDTTLKRGLNGKRLEALLNEEYRNRLIFQA
jgi:predicted transposase YbfD/YdcC